MFCEKCGAQFEEGTRICPQCGEPVATEPLKAETPVEKPAVNGFYKSREGKLITGVCAGIGKRWNINPWIVRVIFIIGMFIPLVDVFLLAFYIVGAIRWHFLDA